MTSHLSEISRVVSNASPLIYFSKIGQLHVLKRLFDEIIIPIQVFREVCSTQDTPDSLVVMSAVNDGWIQSKKIISKDAELLAESSGIDIGEAAAILLAKDEHALLLIDDKMGRSAAEMLGVNCLGSVGVLLQSLSDSIIDYNKFVFSLDRMIDLGFRLDSKIYRLIMRMAEQLNQ